MFRGSTVSTLIGACATILAFAGPAEQGVMAAEPSGSAAAQEWARNNPPSRVEARAEPVVKDNTHPKVTPEEREAIGLPAPLWAGEGKVQPAVSAALGQQRELIRKDPMAGFQGDRPVGFQDTAYVDVYLRHHARGEFGSTENGATIQQLQKNLLSSLTAAEFSLIFAFRNAAAVVGYVNEAGLAKLTNDPRVVAVGLDDQPRPQDPPRAYRGPQPLPRPGEPFGPKPIERVGKIDAAALDALEKSDDGYVFVIVILTPIAWAEVGPERGDALVKETQGRLLSALTADEFRLRGRSSSGGFNGFVNRAGLKKLDQCPDVVSIHLEELLTPAAEAQWP